MSSLPCCRVVVDLLLLTNITLSWWDTVARAAVLHVTLLAWSQFWWPRFSRCCNRWVLLKKSELENKKVKYKIKLREENSRCFKPPKLLAWATAYIFWDMKPEPWAVTGLSDGLWWPQLLSVELGQLQALSLSRHITSSARSSNGGGSNRGPWCFFYSFLLFFLLFFTTGKLLLR